MMIPDPEQALDGTVSHVDMAASALHLPEEILGLIAAHLRLPSATTIGERRNPDSNSPGSSDQAVKLHLRTLACLSRTSKTLHRIVKPVLYHTYPGTRVANARSFVKTLAKDPECAATVREIVIDQWEHIVRDDENPIDQGPYSLDIQCLQYLRNMSSCNDVGLGSTIGAELDRGRADVVLTTLVLLCDNVEVLEAPVPSFADALQRGAPIRGGVVRSLLDELPARWTTEAQKRYQKIRSMAIRLRMYPREIDWGCMFGKRMLMMPNVENFSAWRISCSGLLEPRQHGIEEPPWPGLRRIELRECVIDNAMLGHLLLRAPNLRDIDLHWALQECTLDFRDIAASLNTLGADLESVKLDTRNAFILEFDPHLVFYQGQDEPLGNLEPMVRLKHLAVTPHALIGSDRYLDPSFEVARCLPASLTSLQILGTTYEDSDNLAPTRAIYRHLAPILQDNSSMCSNLRSIDFQLAAYAMDDSDGRQWRCDATKLHALDSGPGFNMIFTRQ